MEQDGAMAHVKYRASNRKALYFKAKAGRSQTAVRQNPNKQMRRVVTGECVVVLQGLRPSLRHGLHP